MRATKVNAGLAESNGRLVGIWRDSLHVTCGLTACTPGSAPGPTLGNEYGKTLPFTLLGHSHADLPSVDVLNLFAGNRMLFGGQTRVGTLRIRRGSTSWRRLTNTINRYVRRRWFGLVRATIAAVTSLPLYSNLSLPLRDVPDTCCCSWGWCGRDEMRVMTMLLASCCRRQCRSVSTAVYVVVAATHLLCLSDFSQGNLSRMFSYYIRNSCRWNKQFW